MSLDHADVLGVPEFPADAAGVDALVSVIRKRVAMGRCMIVAVGAQASRQAELWRQATPPVGPLDASDRAGVLARGPQEAAAMLRDALERAGTPAVELDTALAGPSTRGSALFAEPRTVNSRAIAAGLGEAHVVILPAGIGFDDDARITWLGDDGATLTAVFVAERLAIPVELTGEDVPELPRRPALFARQFGVAVRRSALAGVAVGAA
ncbi:MAG: hypothetical protein ACTS27_11910 [Phycisphaerales bacterium]